MTTLTIYPDSQPEQPTLRTDDPARIAAELDAISVSFARWSAAQTLPPSADAEAVLSAYAGEIARLKAEKGYRSADVVRVKPDHPDRVAMRNKFLSEHTHSEDEVRFFVEGAGTFYLHTDGKVYQVRCERDDLLGVPAGIRHWFDMGPEPFFGVIRLFLNQEGWVAHFTGNTIADRFPRHDAATR